MQRNETFDVLFHAESVKIFREIARRFIDSARVLNELTRRTCRWFSDVRLNVQSSPSRAIKT